MRVTIALLTLACCLASTGTSSAQQQISTGTITGVVRDESGLAVPGATIEAVHQQTGQIRRAVSGTTGDFSLPALPIGRYTLRVSLGGFDTVEQVDIQLRSNEAFNAGAMTLRVGSLEETVTVAADTAGVQTATAVRTQVVEAAEIQSMVTRGRDPIRALNALPGVLPALDIDVGGDLLGGVIGTTLPTIQGTAGFASYVAIDGIGSADGDTGRNNGIASLDSVEEVRVVLSSYSAEFGPEHRTADQHRHAFRRSALLRQSVHLFPPRSAQLQSSAERAARPPEAASPLLHGRRHAWRPRVDAGRRQGETHVLLLHARAVGHEAAREPEYETDAHGGRASGGLLADDAYEWAALLRSRSAAARSLQPDGGRVGVLPRKRDPGRSHESARPGGARSVPAAELLRHQRQPAAVQLP